MKLSALKSLFLACQVLCLTSSSSILAQQITTPGDYERSIKVDDRDRTYYIHVPPGYDAQRPTALVLVYHGGGSNAQDWIKYCGMNECSDTHAFICVYPDGTGHVTEQYKILGWNGGEHRPGGDDPKSLNVDDVKFTSSMLDALEKELNIDTSRVYAAGMSMGAIMVYRLASELSDRIAAIAPIAGAMGQQECQPKMPVSIIDFHGTDDPAVPFNGGKGKIDPSGADYISVAHSIDAWVQANHCDTKPSQENLPDKSNDGTQVIKIEYANGTDGSAVVLYRITGGGHTWPDRDFGPEMAILGKSTKDISANELIWDFFSHHHRKQK